MTTSISQIDLKSGFNKIYEIRQIILSEYSSTIRAINTTSDKLQLGTCVMLLKSLYNHLTSLEFLIEKCYAESSGAVAASLWEKSITLQYLLLDVVERINIYSKHDTFKKIPWTMKDMVTGIVKNEHLSKGKKLQDSIDLLYLQYSYLCAIKHGNSYTTTYFNRTQQGENFFTPSPLISKADKDILGLLYSFSLSALFDALREFSRVFCNPGTYEKLKDVDRKITQMITQLGLKVPTIITASMKDFRPEFWNLLKELDEKHIS